MALFVLSLCPFDISVGIGAFVIGLGQNLLLFVFISNTRGDGYWKLNSSYLEQDDYKAGIKQLCTEVTNMIDIDDIDKWELLKIKAKDFSINFAKCYRNDMKTKIQNIEKEISLIEDKKIEIKNC